MGYLDDPSIAISISIILLGFALGLPNVELGIFGIDFGAFSNGTLIILRLGIIALALSIGIKPLENKDGDLM